MWVVISQRSLGDRDVLENNYAKFFESIGFKVIPIPNVSKDIESYFDEISISAVVLTGGGDISPSYGGVPESKDISISRDETEKKLLEVAIKRNIPVFGICRGMQFINIFFKGKIIKIKEKIGSKIEHVRSIHEVSITDSRLSKLLGKNKIKVNSYHNLGLTKDMLSYELNPFAFSDDNMVEGVYHKKYPIAGVLWHPEREGSDREIDKKIISSVVERKLFWEKR